MLSHFRLLATPGTRAHQASLSFTTPQSLLTLMSIESVMPSNHLIHCRLLFLLPSLVPSIRVFSKESVLRIRWPKYWRSSFSISPSNEYSGLICPSLLLELLICLLRFSDTDGVMFKGTRVLGVSGSLILRVWLKYPEWGQTGPSSSLSLGGSQESTLPSL